MSTTVTPDELRRVAEFMSASSQIGSDGAARWLRTQADRLDTDAADQADLAEAAAVAENTYRAGTVREVVRWRNVAVALRDRYRNHQPQGDSSPHVWTDEEQQRLAADALMFLRRYSFTMNEIDGLQFHNDQDFEEFGREIVRLVNEHTSGPGGLPDLDVMADRYLDYIFFERDTGDSRFRLVTTVHEARKMLRHVLRLEEVS